MNGLLEDRSRVQVHKRAHGEAEAERLLGEGLKILEVEAGSLAKQPKGMAQKRVLVWWLRGRTTTGRRWVSERLWMGDESAESRAVRLLQAGRAGELQSSTQRLLASARCSPKE